MLYLLLWLYILYPAEGQQIRQRSIPFAPFRLECPKLHGVMRMTIEMTNSAGGSRRDLMFTNNCQHIDSFFPVPPYVSALEREQCKWSEPMDNFTHSKINGKCPEDHYFAGLSRIAPKTVALLCCKLRSRRYGDCAQLDFPKVTPTSPIADFYDGRGVLTSIQPGGRGVFRATFCTLITKTKEELLREAEQDSDSEDTSREPPPTPRPRPPRRRTPNGGAPRRPNGGAPRRPNSGAPRRPNGGAPRRPNGGAPRRPTQSPRRRQPGAELIQERITTAPRVSPVISHSLDTHPQTQEKPRPWGPIIIEEEEIINQARETESDNSDAGGPPSPPPIKIQESPVAGFLLSRHQSNKDNTRISEESLPAEPQSVSQPISELYSQPPLTPLTATSTQQITSKPPPTPPNFTPFPTDEPVLITSNMTQSTTPLSSFASESVESKSVSRDPNELIAGNGIFQFILGKQTTATTDSVTESEGTSKLTTSEISTTTQASFDFDLDVDFDVVPTEPKSESDMSQSLIIFEHSLKDKSIFDKPMKMRHFPIERYMAGKDTTQSTTQSTTSSSSTTTSILPHTTTTVVQSTPHIAQSPRRPPPRRQQHRRRRPDQEVLRFCSKDIAVLDEKQMIIACGMSGRVWDPPHCSGDASCMQAHDATYMICCPVYKHKG